MTIFDEVNRRRCELKIIGRFHAGNRPSFEVEGDPRHAEIIVSELGLTSERTNTVDVLENRDGMKFLCRKPTACLTVVAC